jgi:thymidylate synthase
MLLIHANNAVAAWRDTLVRLFRTGASTDNEKYFRDELVVIALENPGLERCDPLFPMPAKELDIINRFITTGENEANVCHEWTKLYFHRMFDEPHNQVKYVLEKLQLDEPVGEAMMSIWEKSVDQYEEVSPCTLVLWARKKHGKLEMHVHAHSSDAYKKLLMNLQEFIAVQKYLAEQLKMPVGRYYHILDSCHIHGEDRQVSEQLVEKIESEEKALAGSKS